LRKSSFTYGKKKTGAQLQIRSLGKKYPKKKPWGCKGVVVVISRQAATSSVGNSKLPCRDRKRRTMRDDQPKCSPAAVFASRDNKRARKAHLSEMNFVIIIFRGG
jgi:hypothetical protein